MSARANTTRDSDNVIYDNYFKRHRSQSLESSFDEFMELVQGRSFSEAIITVLSKLYETKDIYYWRFCPTSETFFCPTLLKEVGIDGNLVGKAVMSGEIICSDPLIEEQLSLGITEFDLPEKSVILIIPVLTNDKSPVGSILITRPGEFQFLEHDRTAGEYFMKKLQLYSPYIFEAQKSLGLSMEIALTGSMTDSAVSSIKRLLRDYFKAKHICIMQKATENMYMTWGEMDSPECISSDLSGIAGYCLKMKCNANEKSVKNSKYFNSGMDGPGDEPGIYVHAQDENKKCWVIGLRGRQVPPYFTKADETQLNALIPFVIKAVNSRMSPRTWNAQYESLEERLTVLLDVAETLAEVLDIDKLIPTIMSRACDLLNADRCSLFLLDKTSQELITTFHGGLSKSIRMPINKGIVGYTAATGQVVNIEDAYNDSRFDNAIDIATGYRTVSLLSVPIFNNRGEITGVTEMMNKRNGSFTEDDIRMMMAFNVFCGTSLDNARLYKASLDLAKQLRTFTELSTDLTATTKTFDDVLLGILDNAKSIVSATRATIFVYDNNENTLETVASVGERNEFGTMFAQESVTLREPKLYSCEEVADKVQSNRRGSVIERLVNTDDDEKSKKRGSKLTKKNRAARISQVLQESAILDHDNTSKLSICCIPLMNSEQSILGVMELASKWKIATEDMKLLECFAVFASVSLDRKRLKEIANIGQIELELAKWIMPNERNNNEKIPVKFMLPGNQLKQLWTNSFDAPIWDGIGHIKVLFNVFYRFDLLNMFNVSNAKFFRFVCEMRDMYKKVPYHNWRHAVDVTQYVTYEILVAKLDRTFTRFEIFAMLISTICHDANHDGFTNVYNEKAETPLGILYKNQSVMETHHCTVSINILSRDECNILETFTGEEYKRMWNLIISLILSTDMAKHFEMLKTFNAIYDAGEWSLDKQEHRMMLMELVLKCGDISNVSRPFDLADKWCDVLCEEFWRQGDLESANGMEYTSPMNDRSHIDKPKSQIGFYTFVCLPLYQATAKAVPPLECNVNQVLSNLAVWKHRQELAAKEQTVA